MTARERTIIRVCMRALQGSAAAQKQVDSFLLMYGVKMLYSRPIKDDVAILLRIMLEDAK